MVAGERQVPDPEPDEAVGPVGLAASLTGSNDAVADWLIPVSTFEEADDVSD
ncbi:MAG: hypothetical protein NTAFB05_07100 [Nitrobacter sp.]